MLTWEQHSTFGYLYMIEKVSNVIFIDDESSIRKAMSQLFELEDLNANIYADAGSALSQIHVNWPGIIVTDLNMPGIDGMELINRVSAIDDDLPIIVLTGYGDVSIAVEAMRAGAYDFMEKPFDNQHFMDVVNRALEKRSLTLENRNLREVLSLHSDTSVNILGNSPDIVKLKVIAQSIANTNADILIYGETGTGKDLLSRYLHERSDRRDSNYVAINCGAMPEELIESELFGHEPGAFTGASKLRIGKFEHANGGTLFLDEIESMPLSLQVKLLRVIEERSVERLGSNRPIELDVRIVAATKEDLKLKAERGEFRLDLFYRLNILTLDIPPLRNRPEDILLLFEHYSQMAAARYGRSAPDMTSSTRSWLLNHRWEGNVRELRNIAERYVLLGDLAFDASCEQGDAEGAMALPEKVERYEKSLITSALVEHKGVITATMNSLGLPRKTLYEKMKKHRLDKKDFK